ncbi:MAG: hypothetical protein ACI9WU_000300 [Myxococcota bacterium]
MGIAITVATVLGATSECERRGHSGPDECVFASPFLQGIFFGASGIAGGMTMSILGLATEGPEAKGRSPRGTAGLSWKF